MENEGKFQSVLTWCILAAGVVANFYQMIHGG